MMRWVLLVALALCACKKSPEPPAAPPPASDAVRDRAFWVWVTANVDALKGVKTGHEPTTEALSAELTKVQPGLVFELGVGREPFELIISADGELTLFPVVKRLVAAAPAIPGAKIIAFRPRKAVEQFAMDFEGRRLSGADLSFRALPDTARPGRVAIELYVDGWDDAKAKGLRNAAFLLLEAAVGEFDLETKVGAIEILPLPEKPKAPLKPLADLPATLDAWK